VRVSHLIPIALAVLAVSHGAAQSPRSGGAPETFTANAQVKAAAGAIAATIVIDIRRYTPDFDRRAVEAALKGGGYPAFLTALRKAPDVGSVGIGDQKFVIRWAREQKTAKGRTVVVITDSKPRAGYEVAVIQLMVDEVGPGTGTMAAAARVKPGGESGVQIDDYADEPITFVAVSRKMP
jgi:hypothetical protein